MINFIFLACNFSQWLIIFLENIQFFMKNINEIQNLFGLWNPLEKPREKGFSYLTKFLKSRNEKIIIVGYPTTLKPILISSNVTSITLCSLEVKNSIWEFIFWWLRINHLRFIYIERLSADSLINPTTQMILKILPFIWLMLPFKNIHRSTLL